MNHSLINANRNTHAKIAVLAVAMSLVFVVVASTAKLSAPEGARTYGPVVKAPAAATMMATSGASAVR